MAQEFNLTIEEALRNGLRRDIRNPVNSPFLSVCKHVKPTQYGLDKIGLLTDPFASGAFSGAGVNQAFPYPQLFRSKRARSGTDPGTILIDDAEVWNVTETAGAWTLTSLLATLGADSSGWHFVDMSPAWLLINPAVTVLFTPITSTTENPVPGGTVVKNTDGVISTGCVHEGRVIFAGFNGTGAWSPWDLDGQTTFLNPNMIAWTPIGGGDIFRNFQTYTYPQILEDEQMYRQDWGTLPMEFQGKILAVRPLKQYLIAFSPEGVTVCQAQTVDTGAIAINTYGIVTTLNDEEGEPIGLAGRMAVAGNKDRGYMFIDSVGVLWRLAPDLGLERLGYSEYFDAMTPADINIQYDPKEREYFISDGGANRSYIRTKTGLAVAPRHVTAIVQAENVTYGIEEDIDTADEDAWEVDSELVDMGGTAVKDLESVEVAMESVTSLQARGANRFSQVDSLTNGAYRNANKEGVTRIQRKGTAFKVGIKGNMTGGTGKVERINIRYKIPDRRNIRGRA